MGGGALTSRGGGGEVEMTNTLLAARVAIKRWVRRFIFLDSSSLPHHLLFGHTVCRGIFTFFPL